jgi:signal transduction histidine kinase
LSDINLDNDLTHSIENLVSTVEDSVTVLNICIDDLRNITNIDGEVVNVNEQLTVLQDQLYPSVKRWQISFNLFPEDLMISFNPWRFRSIVDNAINNSSASLRTKKLQDSKPSKTQEENKPFQGTINISSYLEENLVIVEVTDNGIGIPEDMIAELYKTDKRLNNSAGESKGNGSMIIDAYLKLHQADVKVFNNEDSGATVKFIFSLQQSK